MPALVAGIHVFSLRRKQVVDGRDKPGHDEEAQDFFQSSLPDFGPNPC